MEEIKQDDTQEKLGVRELLEKVVKNQESLATEKKVSKWKLPWKANPNRKQVTHGYATFCLIRENGEVDFVKSPINDLTTRIDGFPRIASPEYRLTLKGKPFYIIPSWSMKPFSPVENYSDAEKEKMHMAGRRVILAKLEGEQIKNKKGLGFNMGWVMLILGIIVVGYYFLKNAGWM